MNYSISIVSIKAKMAVYEWHTIGKKNGNS